MILAHKYFSCQHYFIFFVKLCYNELGFSQQEPYKIRSYYEGRDIMNTEILCFGSELLHGDIVNSNAAYLSKKLAEIGINVYYHSVVGDNHQRMEEAFRIAFERVDLVICTGGLGPTQDDITKEILARYHGQPMQFDPASLEHVKHIYRRLNRPMPESNLRQAYFPQGSHILPNPFGTANGCYLKKNGKIAILLPGPPKEMIPMFENHALPLLMPYSDGVIQGRKYVVTGLGESTTEERIMDLVTHQSNPTIATFAGNGRVIVRVTAKAKDASSCDLLLDPIETELLDRLRGHIYITETMDPATHTANRLIEKNLTLALAESCTGGLLASKLTACPGISSVFLQGYITYSNTSKIQTLGVREETIETYGAVSSQTAVEMAQGALSKAGSQIGVAITGIAGPSGGTLDKPVGLVYVAVVYQDQIVVKTLNYPGTREVVRERSAVAALDILNHLLK